MVKKRLIIVFILLIALLITPASAAIETVFTVDKYSGPEPFTVHFVDRTPGNIIERTWDFGDGTSGTGKEISHTYMKKYKESQGEYRINLTVTDDTGQQGTSFDVISVEQPLNLGFYAEPGPDPFTCTFHDTSNDWYPLFVEWDFGDQPAVNMMSVKSATLYGSPAEFGPEYNLENISHAYTNPGTYSIRLTVVDKRENVNSVYYQDYITVLEGGTVVVNPVVIPTPPTPVPTTIPTPVPTLVPETELGKEWIQAIEHADFSDRYGHSTVVFHDKLWVIGGSNNGHFTNDVWSTSNGVTWDQVASYTAFSPRMGHSSLVFNDKIWVIGGRDRYTMQPLHDVWYSSDGVTWTQATSAAPFVQRWSFGATVFDGKMWITGGSVDGILCSDVWYSSDGITWIQATPDAGYPKRMEPSLVSYKGKLWVTSGYDWKNHYNDVWSSADGITWTRETANAEFPARRYQNVEVMNGALWLIGGYDGSKPLTDVWYSIDGITWIPVTPNAAFPGRYAFTTATFKNRLWIIGGSNGNDVWYSGGSEDFPPIAGFVPSIYNGTAPLEVQFTDHSMAGTSPITSYYWGFGDGTNSTLQNPSHTFTKYGGNFVTETITDSLSRTASYNATITVLPAPVVPPAPRANFLMDNAQGYSPLTVSFTDFSSGDIVEWNYNFGDGAISTERNPTHTYTASDKGLYFYSPWLWVKDSRGRQSIFYTNFGAVNFNGPDPNAPVANFDHWVISSPPNRPGVQLRDLSQRANYLTYYFGDGSTDPFDRNPTHYYFKPAFYRITQSVTNTFGSRDKTVNLDFGGPYPTKPSSLISASFATDYDSGDSPLTVQFYDQSWGGITSYHWDFGDGTTSSLKSPVHTFTGSHQGKNTYITKLTVADRYGAISEYANSITVWGASGSVSPTPTVTVTPTGTGSTGSRLIAYPTGIKYTGIFGPDMSTLYTVYTTVYNPNPFDVPTDFTITEVEKRKGLGEEFKTNSPVTVISSKYIPAKGSFTYQYSYIHKWKWTEIIEGSDALKQAADVILSYTSQQKTIEIAVIELEDAYHWDSKTINEWVALKDLEKTLGVLNKILGVVNVIPWLIAILSPVQYEYVPSASNIDGLTTIPVDIYIGGTKQTAYGASLVSASYGGTLTNTAIVSIIACPVTGGITCATGGFAGVGEAIMMYLSTECNRIAVDPDSNYSSPISVVPDAIPELYEAPDSPMRTYIEQMVPLVNHSQSLSQSYAKYLGAQQAQDQVWETKLLKDCYYYSSQIENDFSRINASTGPAIQYLDEIGYHPTMQDVETAKQHLRTNGLPDIEIRLLKRWNFTDQDILIVQNISLKTPDSLVVNYNTSLYALNAMSQQQFAVMNAQFAADLGPNAPPYANFTVSTTSGTAPLTVEFTDASLRNATLFYWDFGDNQTIQTQNPDVFYTYSDPGTYTVTLTATSPTGSDTRVKYELITVTEPNLPVANFTATNTTGKVPLTVQFNDTSFNATAWTWDFGDTTTATEQNPLHTYTVAGNYTVSLTATNPDGTNTKTMTDLITVNPLTPPIPNFTATPRSGRIPLTVMFNDTSTGGLPTLWYWTFGDGADAAGPNVTHTYTTPGNYTVVFEVANYDADVFETRPDYITVLPVPAPVADFSGTPTSGNAPLTVQFSDLSTESPTSWAWNFGDGYVSTVQNPVHQYDVSGTYTVNLTATNDGGSNTKTLTNYITVVKPSDPITLIDQLIVYIRNQNNVPKIIQRLMIGELMDVKYSLQQNHPDDAVMEMKFFKLTVNLFRGWMLTSGQVATMQNSADAIIKEINLPVNQAAIDQTKSLSVDVKSLRLSSSVERPLLLELEGTLFNLECAKDTAAITHLNMFIKSVKAQDGKKIPHDKAVQLVTKAEAIKTTIKP